MMFSTGYPSFSHIPRGPGDPIPRDRGSPFPRRRRPPRRIQEPLARPDVRPGFHLTEQTLPVHVLGSRSVRPSRSLSRSAGSVVLSCLDRCLVVVVDGPDEVLAGPLPELSVPTLDLRVPPLGLHLTLLSVSGFHYSLSTHATPVKVDDVSEGSTTLRSLLRSSEHLAIVFKKVLDDTLPSTLWTVSVSRTTHL